MSSLFPNQSRKVDATKRWFIPFLLVSLILIVVLFFYKDLLALRIRIDTYILSLLS